MKAAAFCIKHRVTTIMACIMIVIFGVMGFSSLPLAMLPNIELPMAIVYATYVGAGPAEIENLVTKPLESACAGVAGLDTLDSQSSENMSMLMITFADGTDMDEALVSLREKIDQAKSMLPKDASAPTVMKLNVDAMPIASIGLRGADLAQLQQIAEDDITPALERIDGVAQVQVYGGFGEEVAVYTYADRLLGYGLNISYITQMLAAENVAIPAGTVENGSQTLSVRTTGEFASVADIANVLIPLPSGGSVRLGEIADLSIQPTTQDAIAKMGTDAGVVLSVMKQSDVNTVQVANRIQKQLAALTEENPTLQWEMLFDQSDFINQSVKDVISNILLGVLLAALVLLYFLRDFGATAVISVAMPVCIVSVFLVMSGLGITMNMMSLGGLAMGVGMIVDNSIVVLENIFRYRADGFSRWESCTQGTGEVALSIIAGTLTTVAVFLPIGLSSGLVGMMFREFSITISALLLSSLAIALTLVPLLCYLLLDRGKQKQKLRNSQGDMADKPLMRLYKRLLTFFIHRRAAAMLISLGMVVLFGISIAIAGFEMMPAMDQGQISVAVEMPIGSEMEETAVICDRVTAIALDTIPEIESLYYTTGSGGGMAALSGGTAVVMDIGSKAGRDRGVDEIVSVLRSDLEDIAGCELTVTATGTMDMSSMTGQPIAITLRGNDYTSLTAAADGLAAEIAALPDAVDVVSSAADQTPQVDITLNRTAASRFGLNAAAVGQAVRSELTGTAATELKADGKEISISVKGDSRSQTSLDALRAIALPTPAGGTVPLGAVAEVNVVLAPQQISRHNQSRTVTITGDSRSSDAVGISRSVAEVIADFRLPADVTIESGGEAQEIVDSFISLAKALLVGLVLIYFVLASQFESFLLPVMVMMILPVGLIGSLVGLPLSGQKISIVAFLGVIILAGTVVNSAIVLVDYIKIRRSRGEDKNTAILNACPRRVRPVLMTTLTTILGLVPMALGLGEGSEMMVPMAVVMITGMVVSTIVTLLFTPVYYSLLDSLSMRMRRKKDGGEEDDSPQDHTEAPAQEAAHV